MDYRDRNDPDTIHPEADAESPDEAIEISITSPNQEAATFLIRAMLRSGIDVSIQDPGPVPVPPDEGVRGKNPVRLRASIPVASVLAPRDEPRQTQAGRAMADAIARRVAQDQTRQAEAQPASPRPSMAADQRRATSALHHGLSGMGWPDSWLTPKVRLDINANTVSWTDGATASDTQGSPLSHVAGPADGGLGALNSAVDLEGDDDLLLAQALEESLAAELEDQAAQAAPASRLVQPGPNGRHFLLVHDVTAEGAVALIVQANRKVVEARMRAADEPEWASGIDGLDQALRADHDE